MTISARLALAAALILIVWGEAVAEDFESFKDNAVSMYEKEIPIRFRGSTPGADAAQRGAAEPVQHGPEKRRKTSSHAKWYPSLSDVRERHDCEDLRFPDWFQDRERGWYFYETCPRKAKGRPSQEVSVAAAEERPGEANSDKEPLVVSVLSGEATRDLTPHEVRWLRDPRNLNRLSAREVRRVYSDMVDLAVMEPTLDNISTHVSMKNFIDEKANHFAYAVKAYTLNNPEYDVSRYEGESEGPGDQLSALQANKRWDYLKERQDRVGLIFFVSPGCSACQKQVPLLWWFHKNTGIAVEPVSATACMEQWPDCTISPEAFEHYGVSRTPTLMMVYRSEPSPDAPYVTQIVSNGVISVGGLVDRMATFMRYWDKGKFMDSVDLGESYEPGKGFSEADVSTQSDWLLPEREPLAGPGFAGPAFR